MKAVKIVSWVLAGICAFIMIMALSIPLWIGPVVKGVANSTVPDITGTGFRMDAFGLNPYTGRLHIGGVELQNPERFFVSQRTSAEEGEGLLDTMARHASNAAAAVGDAVSSSETNALSFTSIDVDLAVLSLLGDTIRIEEIEIKDLSIYGDLTFSNFREIAENASTDKKETEEEKAAEKEEPAKEEPKAAEEKTEEEPKAEKKKNVVVDHVLITGTVFQWGHLRVPLPDIELKDVGKDEPVDEDGLWDKILDSICESADKAHAGLGTAFKAAVDGGKAAGKAVGDAAKAFGGMAGDAAGTVKDAASGAADTVKDAASNAADAVTDAASGAIDSVKGLFK